VLRRVFGPKRDEVTEEYQKLHNEEGEACSMYEGQERCTQAFGGERDHLEYSGIDGRIKLRWIFKKWDWEAWTGLIWLRIGTGGRFL